ncbi:MAG: efflux RND transporter periplasmic adaptor subunit [Thermoanaerobaculia bacterium]
MRVTIVKEPMKKFLRLTLPCLFVLGLPGLLVVSCRKEPPGAVPGQQLWQCAMHPQVVRDKPGDCPICGMKLVPIAGTGKPVAPAAPAAPGAAPSARRLLFYRSPMNPAITSPVARKDEMGMDFVPVYEGEASPVASTVPGLATVHIDADKRRAMGLRTKLAERRPFATTIRTAGRVTFDERRVHHIHTKYDAYVEDVPNEVNFVGAAVKHGQRLLSLYSPDLFATEQEYLLALKARSTLGGSGIGGVAQGGADLLDAARQRLLLWDLSPADLSRIEKSGKASRTFDLYAPMSGYVIGKMAVHGMKVSAADSLFDIADLSRLWVLADIYESELPRISVGLPATMTLSYWPGRTWKGAVTYVFPMVDEKTRTVKVRIDVDNSDAALKPEMFADVVIQGRTRQALVVPDDAVLDSGTRRIVFVSQSDGELSPREIVAGGHSEGLVEVLSGLAEGEAVALGANFLLDSESRLKSALATFEKSAPAAPPRAAPAAPPAHGPQP